MWKAAFTGRSEVSSTSSRKKTSGTESGVSTSSRKAEDERRRSEKSRGSTYDETESTYATAPSSRNGEPRGLTESAMRSLNGEDEWEDEDKDARSERRSVRSDGKRHRRKGEHERSRSGSRSRDKRSDKRDTPSRRESGTSRGKSRGLDEGDDRAIPDMGSFEQFPGQYANGQMGDGGQQEFMMSGAMPSSADNQFGLARADTFGAAADYYQDEGQSVSAQPGFRAKSPNMLVNPDQHLMAASATEQPAQDTGHGSAADFYAGNVSPVPFETPSGKPARQSSGSSKPGRTSSLGTGAALGAAGALVGGLAGVGSASNTQYQTTSTSGKQSGGSASMSSSKPPRKPSRNNSAPVASGSAGSYYAPPSQQQQDPRMSGKQSSNSHAGLYTAGAAAAVGAAGLAAYEMHEHKQHEHEQEYQQQQNEYRASNSQYSGAQYGLPPSSAMQSGVYSNGAQIKTAPFHEHKGPMTRLKDGLLNLISSEEDVMKMEMYTEYIGVCKYCFDPRTSPYDAPRVHHYHTSNRKDSFEDLRKRKSIERMRRSSKEGLNRTGSNRVDKDSRYYSSDAARRRKSSDKAALVGAGIATAGAVAGANALFNDRKDFDDTYSVKSGHREGSAVRRRSRSSSREQRRKATYGVVDKETKEEYVTVRTKDGRVEKRKVRRRSRSTSKDRSAGIAAAATGAAIGASAVAASSPRHGREQSSKRSRRSRSSSRSSRQNGFFGGFFSPSRDKQRRGSRTERKKKESGFFNFGNGSVSSDSDLAFSGSRTDLPLRRKASMKSTKRKNSDEHIAATVAGIGVTAAALAAAQNGRRVHQRNGRPELGARRDVKTTPITGPDHRHGSPGSSEGDWQDEDELPSDVDDASSAGSDLAFGGDDRRLSKRQSIDSIGSQSSTGGFLGWRWGRKDKKKQHKPSKPVSSYQSRHDGATVAGVAAGTAAVYDDAKLRRTESGVTSNSSIPQRPMQEIDPRPISEAGSTQGSRHASMPGAFDPSPPIARPGPGPIQQPKPIAPIQPAFTDSPTEMDSRDAPRPRPPRRTQSSPTQSNFMQDAALVGAAALGTAGIIASQGRKAKDSNVRWGLTEEQERKHEREDREKGSEGRRRADRERALKEEAARHTREQDVLRAREEENRRAAEAKLERQRAAEREAEQQAEMDRQREREQRDREQRDREDAYNRDQARRAEEEARQQEQIRWQHEQDEYERSQGVREDRQKYEPMRDTEQRRQYDRRDQPYESRRETAEGPSQEYDRRSEEESKRSSVPWGAVATGVAAASAGAFAASEYERRKERETDERRGYPIRDDKIERREGYQVQEVKPPDDHPSIPVEDDDIYNPESFRRGTRSASDYARHVALARRAAEKVVAADNVVSENDEYYNEPSRSQAEFFAPAEILDRTPEGKERVADPIGDNEVNVYKRADDEVHAVFQREWAVSPQESTRYAPYGVPKLGLVSPTPPPNAFPSARRRAPSPLASSQGEESQVESGVSESSPRSRTVSWGVDQTHVYDAPTPEVDHEDRPSYVDHRDVSSAPSETTSAAGITAGVTTEPEAAGPSSDRPDSKPTGIDDGGNRDATESRNSEPSYQEPVQSADLAMASPGTEGAPPVRGFIEGEVHGPLSQEEKRHHVPGGFDDEYEDSHQVVSGPSADPEIIPPTSKTNDRQDLNEDRDAASLNQREQTEPNDDMRVEDEESAEKPRVERKLSKKEKRKREKAAKRAGTLDDDEMPIPTEDTISAPEERSERTLEDDNQKVDGDGSDGKKQGFADVAGALMTTGGIAAVAANANAKGEASKGKKNKKGKKSREPDRDTRNAEASEEPPADEEERPPSTMPGSWGTDASVKEGESSSDVIGASQDRVQEDWQPSFPPTAKAPPVTSVQETTSSPGQSSREPETKPDDGDYSEAGSGPQSHTPASDGLAATAATMYENRASRPSEHENGDQRIVESQRRDQGDERRPVDTNADGERDHRRIYNEEQPQNNSRYYDEPETYDSRSAAASERYDAGDGSRKSKRRSRREDDEIMSVASSGSRRERDSPDSARRDKKSGFFGGIFHRKSADSASAVRPDGDSLSRHSTRDSRDEAVEDDEHRHRHRRRTDSEYGEDDDTRSMASESRHRHHHRRKTDDDYYEPSRRDAERSDRHRHRRRTNDETDVRDQSFLGSRVEDMPPLPGSLSESAGSAPIKEERESGIPASAEADTELVSRERANAFDLIRHNEHEHPAADAFDLIRHNERERPPADAFDLIHHDQSKYSAPPDSTVGYPGSPRNEAMDIDEPDFHTKIDENKEQHTRDVGMEDWPGPFGSGPTSPTTLPETETPERRISVGRPISTTAVPLRFPFGHQPPTPSPRMDRAASFGGSIPVSPATPGSSQKTRQGRPMSNEIRPLYLVERNRQTEEVEEALPSLPSSKPSSRSSSQVGSDEYESAVEGAALPTKRRALTIDTERAGSYRPEPDYLDSQQTTPRATEPPRPIFDRPPRQEPEFYTWEDFAQDERMRTEEIEGQHEDSTAVEERPSTATRVRDSGRPSRSQDDAEDLPALPPSRPESPTSRMDDKSREQGVAAAAILGGAALLAHQAFRNNQGYVDDHGAGADRSFPETVPHNAENVAALDSLMEEGRVSESPEPVEVAPSPRPNELDHFMEVEEHMEEGKIRMRNFDDKSIDVNEQIEHQEGQHITSDPHHSVKDYFDNSIDYVTPSGDRKMLEETSATDQAEPVVEAPSLISSLGDGAIAAGAASDFPVEEGTDQQMVDFEAQASENENSLSNMERASQLTRKQSKKAKKKQRSATQQVSAEQAIPSEEAVAMTVEGMSEAVSQDHFGRVDDSGMQDADVEASSTHDADQATVPVPSKAIPGNSEEQEHEFKAEASRSVFPTELERPASSLPEGSYIPENKNETPIADDSAETRGFDRASHDVDKSKTAVESYLEPSREELSNQPEQDGVFEEVPFLTRKKSKKDKKKQRQQPTGRDIPSVSQRDTTPMEIKSLATSTTAENRGSESEEPAIHMEQRDTTPVDNSQMSGTITPQSGALPEASENAFERSIVAIEHKDTDVNADAETNTDANTENARNKGRVAISSEVDEQTVRDTDGQAIINEPTNPQTANSESAAVELSGVLVSTKSPVEDFPHSSVQIVPTDGVDLSRDSGGLAESDRIPSVMTNMEDQAEIPDGDAADEFTWTSNSKKKGKKGKKAKKSTGSTLLGGENPLAETERRHGSLYGQTNEAVEMIESATSEDPNILLEQPRDVKGEGSRTLSTSKVEDDATEDEHVSTMSTPQDTLDLDRPTAGSTPQFRDRTYTELQSIPGEFRDGQELMASSMPNDDYMEVDDAAEPMDAEASHNEQGMAQQLEMIASIEEPEATREGPITDANEEGSRETFDQESSRTVEEAAEGLPMSEPQSSKTDAMQATTPGVETTEAEEFDSFWVPKQSRKKDKKSKKSKNLATEDVQEQETAEFYSTGAGAADKLSLQASIEPGDEDRQTTSMEDVEFWTAAPKPKKGKKSKKAALLETEFEPTRSDQSSKLEEAGSVGLGAFEEDATTGKEAVDVEPSDSWDTPVKGKKGKKAKKGKEKKVELDMNLIQEERQASDGTKAARTEEESATEASTVQNNTDATLVADDVEDVTDRNMEDVPTTKNPTFEEVDALTAVPNSSHLENELQRMAVDETPDQQYEVDDHNEQTAGRLESEPTASSQMKDVTMSAPESTFVGESEGVSAAEGPGNELESFHAEKSIVDADTTTSSDVEPKPALTSQEQATAIEGEQVEPQEPTEMEAAVPFVVRKSKKDKKGKKSRPSTTDYRIPEPTQKEVREPEQDDDVKPAGQPLVESATGVAIFGSTELPTEIEKDGEEEEDWSGFSKKRSKKDKRKGRRSDSPYTEPQSTAAQVDPHEINPDHFENADQNVNSLETNSGANPDRSIEIEKDSNEHSKSTVAILESSILEEHASSETGEIPADEGPVQVRSPTKEIREDPDTPMQDDQQESFREMSNVTAGEPTVHDWSSQRPLESNDVGDHSFYDEALINSSSEPTIQRFADTPASNEQRDIDFTETVAAGLAESGFDSDMVMNDPTFQRRASPPGTIAEGDPEEIAPTIGKRKKGLKAKGKSKIEEFTIDDQGQDAAASTAPRSSADDFNQTLEKTLAGTGFDTNLLQKMTSSDDTSSNEITGDSMLSFGTSKRKKGKKSKGKETPMRTDVQPLNLPESDVNPRSEVNETEASSETYNNVGSQAGAEEGNPDAENEGLSREPYAREELSKENAAADMVSALSAEIEQPETDLTLAGQREMDVDEMDNAYRVFKRNKRSKKRQKAAASQSETVAESDQREQGLQSSEAFPTAIEKSTSGDDAPTVLDPPERGPAIEAEERGLAAASLDPITVAAAAAATDLDYSPGHGQIRHLETAEDRSRDAKNSSMASFPRSGHDKNASLPWSFANLEDEGMPLPESPVLGNKDNELVRDSGYQEADSPLLQRQSIDSHGSNVSYLQASQSLRGLHESGSSNDLHIDSAADAGWDMESPKVLGAGDDIDITTLRARTPSRDPIESPVESTTKHRASYLFQSTPEAFREAATTTIESPTPGARSSTPENARHVSREMGPQEVREISSGHAGERVFSAGSTEMLSPRATLDTIHEERQGQKRAIAETDIGEPGSTKAIRRSNTPQSVQSRGRISSPGITIPSGDSRSLNSPLSTDQGFSHSPWPSTHETHETTSVERASKSRKSRHTSMDMRSPSAMSNRSNASAGQFRSPEELRSYSRASNRSSTPTLRRVSLSGDLRAASRRGETGSTVGARSSPKTIPFEPPPTPPSNDDELMHAGASRSVNMSDVYQGYGDAEASQTSPTRPPNMRKRQSMHIIELESKLDQLVAENEALQNAKQTRGITGGDDDAEQEINLRDLKLREKDNEISQIRTMLQSMQDEIGRLNEINAGLTEANRNLVDDNNGQFASLQAEHAHAHEQWQSTSRELDTVRQEHGQLTSDMREVVEAEIATALADKNSEIRQLREDLDVATERIRALQVQIQSSRSRDFISARDEDYFDGACGKLCQHVQQWVLRFSKLSDDRKCRLSTDLNDEKVEARLDNVVLDGSDVDKLLAERTKRRDVFMSLVMTMIWEYVFTRYLFGMDREQRKKLKDLEKMLDEVGPKRAVAQWRATTLTLLSKRPAFSEQRDLDTAAVANEIFALLCRLLPPPSSAEQQLLASLQRVVGVAVDLSIEMRCQRPEYIMLPPLQPEYDTNGDLVQKVYFNASLMNERSGTFSSNGELEQTMAIVKIVLFPLVVKKGDEAGEGEEEIVVCPAQVLVHNENGRGKRIVRVQSGAMEIDDPRRSQNSLASPGGSTAF